MNKSKKTADAFMKWIWLGLLLGLVACQTPLPESIPSYKMNHQSFKVNDEIASYQTLISIVFEEINFEVGTQMFLQSGLMNDGTALEKQQYNNQFIDACTAYPTTLSTNILASYAFDTNEILLKYVHFQKSAYTSVFILSSNYFITHLAVKPNSVQKMNVYAFDDTVATLLEGNLKENVELLQAGGFLYVFGPDQAHRVDIASESKQFTKLENYSASGHNVITGSGVYNIDKNQIWVSTDQAIFVYSTFSSTAALTEVSKFDFFTNETISGIEFDPKTSHFYVATLDNLHIFSTKNPNDHQTYQLHGICSEISKVESTLYLGCEYERINYVAELRVQELNVNVNRYYDDAILEGVRKVEPLGYDKVAFLGDDEIMVVGEGVHRDILFDMERQNKEQNRRFLYSYGLIDFVNLKLFSNNTSSKVLTITQSHVTLYSIDQIPPEVQCMFRPKDFPIAASLLVGFNTTHCPYEIRGEAGLNGAEVICESLFPFEIVFNVHEYEQKTAKFIFFISIASFFLVALACAGWGIQIRAKATQAMNSLKEKIEKIKQDREKKEENKFKEV